MCMFEISFIFTLSFCVVIVTKLWNCFKFWSRIYTCYMILKSFWTLLCLEYLKVLAWSEFLRFWTFVVCFIVILDVIGSKTSRDTIAWYECKYAYSAQHTYVRKLSITWCRFLAIASYKVSKWFLSGRITQTHPSTACSKIWQQR